jgi:N-formylglutamate amidohydrolase
MSVSRKRAQEYADRLLETPSAHISVTLKRWKNGVTVLHQGRAIARCHASRVGMWTAAFMAQALGLELPPVGASVTVRVSTGTLWRAVGISSLDLRKREARVLLLRLLEEAEMQRAAGTGADME